MGNGVIQLVDIIHLQRLPVVGLEEHGWFRFGVQWDWFYFSNRPFEKRNGPDNSELICF